MKKLLIVWPVLMIIVGVALFCSGVWGIAFTYDSVAKEKIVTPEDSVVPNVSVAGPLTLKAQADIIREHVLRSTGGKTFAEMPRQIPKLDADGKPVLDSDGKPVMVLNTARDLWVTATTLRTALFMAMLIYAFSGLSALSGLLFVINGILFISVLKHR